MKRLRPRNKEVIDRHLAGQTNRQIAADLQYTEVRISQILNSPLAQAELSRRRRDIERGLTEAHVAETTRLLQARTRLEDFAPDSVDRLIELAKSESEGISLRANQSILDILGIKDSGTSRTEDRTNRIEFNVNEMRFLIQCAEESGKGAIFNVQDQPDSRPGDRTEGHGQDHLLRLEGDPQGSDDQEEGQVSPAGPSEEDPAP